MCRGFLAGGAEFAVELCLRRAGLVGRIALVRGVEGTVGWCETGTKQCCGSDVDGNLETDTDDDGGIGRDADCWHGAEAEKRRAGSEGLGNEAAE